jgi:hypothetical protein
VDITKGDKLPVQLKDSNGTDTVVVTNPKKNNAIAGAVAYNDVQALIDCLHEGNEYTAEVLHHSSTSIKVGISRSA